MYVCAYMYDWWCMLFPTPDGQPIERATQPCAAVLFCDEWTERSRLSRCCRCCYSAQAWLEDDSVLLNGFERERERSTVCRVDHSRGAVIRGVGVAGGQPAGTVNTGILILYVCICTFGAVSRAVEMGWDWVSARDMMPCFNTCTSHFWERESSCSDEGASRIRRHRLAD